MSTQNYLFFVNFLINLTLNTLKDHGNQCNGLHADNLSYFLDILDNSGIRIYYTSQLRQHEAGVMETGMEITLTQFIPPHETSFLSEGICSMECLRLVGIPILHVLFSASFLTFEII